MEPNFRVGQFVLDRRIGEGGMAEVWLAHNVHLETPAAVKFLSPQYADRKEIEERFLNEGRRQGSLDHPNIVKVLGFEYVDGRSYLILQYVDGESLEDRVERAGRQPLPFPEIQTIASGVLSALDYAHSKNIVHRDVKPSNILIDKHGNAQLGDFGIVLAVNERRLTRTGTVMGTPYYMSPEQIARPMEVDHRTDIYSFGCVLYEMLTGRTPFEDAGGEGDTDFNVKLAHTQQMAPPVRKFNPAVKHPVEQVVMRCLEKDPADRFSTGRELRDSLIRAFAAPADSKEFDYRRRTVIEKEIVDPDPFKKGLGSGGGRQEIIPPKKLSWFERNKAVAVGGALAAMMVLAAGYHFWPKPDDGGKSLVVHHDPVKDDPSKKPETIDPAIKKDDPTIKKDDPQVKKDEPTIRRDDPSQKKDLPKRKDTPDKGDTPAKKDAPDKDNDPQAKKKEEKTVPDNDSQTVPDRRSLNDSMMSVRLLSPISTKTSKEGDIIRARVISPAAFQGDIVEGMISKSSHKGKLNRKAELLFAFHTLYLNRAQSKAINTQVVSFKNSQGKVKVDDEGQLLESSNGVKKVAIIGAAGAVIGGLFKGKKGAVAGGAAGAGAALMLTTFAAKGPDISFDAGSQFDLKVSAREE